MGADFLLHALTWPKDGTLDWEAGKRQIKESIRTKTENGDALYGLDIVGAEACLQDVKDATNDSRRDAFTMKIAHLNILVTGGMSWGDDPADLFTSISNLYDLDGVFEAVGFFKDDYDYKGMLEKILKVKSVLPEIMGLDPVIDKLIEKKLKE